MAAGIEGNSSHSGSDDLDALFPPSFSSWRGGALSCEGGFPIKVDVKSFFLSVYALLLSSRAPGERQTKWEEMSLSNRLLLWKSRTD